MGFWDKALESWGKGRQFVDDLTQAIDFGEAAAGARAAGQDAAARAGNAALVLTAEQAFQVMTIRHGAAYPRKNATEMTRDEIEAVQWQLVESWKAYRRLSLVTNAVQWAFSKMISGSAPVPGPTDLLNALQALFQATGDHPSRAEVMEFWQKYSRGQLSIVEQVTKGLTEAGTTYRGGSLSNPSRRKVLDDLMNEP